MGKTGSLLLEAMLFLLFIGGIVFFLHVELIRRARFEVLLNYGVFTMARLRALGCSKTESNNVVKEFFVKSLGNEHGKKFFRTLNRSEEITSQGVSVKFHIRYHALIKFPYKNQTKHHFEITRQCNYLF